MRLALGIEYNGSAFHGWQIQPDLRTVQHTLEIALSTIAASPIHVVASGRTDTGVHASGQVVHFDTEVERPDKAWVLGTNTELPDDIRVHWMKAVTDEFHARYSPVKRTYYYSLYNNPIRSCLYHQRVGWFPRSLDFERMQQAAQAFVGEHDFSALRSVHCQAKSPIRTVFEFDIVKQGDFIECVISANAFLHHMIRNMVGVLCVIGTGQRPVSWAQELMQSLDPNQCDPMAGPSGLYLARVAYPEAFQIPGPLPWGYALRASSPQAARG